MVNKPDHPLSLAAPILNVRADLIIEEPNDLGHLVVSEHSVELAIKPEPKKRGPKPKNARLQAN